MKTIKYEICFHTYWHCGSGLAAGADVDALVIKDRDNLPYVPGKTIKGLIREAVDNLRVYKNYNVHDDLYFDVFGMNNDGKSDIKDVKHKKSISFFSNAVINRHDEIAAKGLQRFMYSTVASTAIDSNGIAKNHSLRRMEVVIPCSLEGYITDVPEDMVALLADSFKYVKNMGVNRNRGLGRCSIKEIQE